MKTPLYALVEIDTGIPNRYDTNKIIGYVTRCILKSNQYRNKRVRVMGNRSVFYPRRKQIITIIPFS